MSKSRNEIGDRMLFAVNDLNENEDVSRIPELIAEFSAAYAAFRVEFLDLATVHTEPIGRSYGPPEDL